MQFSQVSIAETSEHVALHSLFGTNREWRCLTKPSVALDILIKRSVGAKSPEASHLRHYRRTNFLDRYRKANDLLIVDRDCDL